MFRKKTFWIVMILLLLAGGYGGYTYYNNVYLGTQTSTEPPLQTAAVRQGDITISATGAGTVIPAEQIELSFTQGGVLTELLVKVGDRVQAGDEIAHLDDADAQQAVANAELQLAQAALSTAPEATERTIALAQIAVEQAEINLASAQVDLDELLNWTPDEADVTLAEADLEATQASYENAVTQDASAGNSLTSARISVEQAERGLADANAAYETAFDPGREWEVWLDEPTCQQGQGGSIPCTGPTFAKNMENERAGAEAGLIRAQDNLVIAQANYNLAVAGLNNNTALNSQAAVLNAEIALENVLTGPTDTEIKTAQIQVQQSELSLRQAQLNLAAAKDNAPAELSQAQAELNLEAAQMALAKMVLVAPVDGTVMVVNVSVGENVGTTALITLAVLDQPLIEVYLDETDLDMVSVDFEAEVIFDALPDETFLGHVVQVDPQLSDINGVSAIRSVLQLDADSFAKPQTMPVGLNATVEVIGGRSTNAMLVPVEALRELSLGDFAVFVMEDEEPRLRMVEVGLMDFTFAEILSGLQAGELVTTGIVNTN